MKMMLILFSLLCVTTVAAQAAEVTATVDARQRRQTIEGFGTCLISWGKTAQSDFYDDELAQIYAEELGLNMLRVNVAPWGYPKTEDPDAITWEKIDLNDKSNSRVPVFIEFGKKLKKYNPELRVIGTVWSPPAWMKMNNNITGGRPWKRETREPGIQGSTYKKRKRATRNRVDPKYYPHFCELMAAMCKLHEQHGVPFYALSPGNEVMFSQTFESCTWIGEDFATIIAMLGEPLEREGYGDVLLYGPETMTQHNWSIANPIYIKELRQNEKAWKHFDRFATHGYVDGFEADMSAESSLQYWNMIKAYDKPYWMTEGGTGGHGWPEALNGVAAAIHNSLVAGNCSAWVPWQIASGNGQENGHALMAGHRLTKKTQAVKHFTRWIDAGAVRLHVAAPPEPLRLSAYYHDENRQLTVVAINPTAEAQSLSLALNGLPVDAFKTYRTSAGEDHAAAAPVQVGNGRATLSLPPESITTLVGQGR